QLFPIHPYVFEAAKVLPHFLLTGLIALVWYNNELNGLKLFPYLKELAARMALDVRSLIWAVPLAGGFALSLVASSMQVYRYRWGSRPPTPSTMRLDADLTSLVGRTAELATPAMRVGRWWNPLGYQRAGWIFRALGLA